MRHTDAHDLSGRLDAGLAHARRRQPPDVPARHRPGVIVIHEIPGITPAVAAFGQEVVDAGYTVVMPSLFGTDGGR